MLPTLNRLQPSDFPALQRAHLETLQVNLGYRCNQRCVHCHVNAGPSRPETMQAETATQILDFLQQQRPRCLDLTGGAPELNPEFRRLVQGARALGLRVIDRCNLTVLWEPEQADLLAFLAAQQVEIIASLPCYTEETVDKQRGAGTFQASIRALQHLNQAGYGQPDSGLILKLVYNPSGPSLPPPQAALEAEYRAQLQTRDGIVFNQLLTLCNMPIQRFGSWLISKGLFDDYRQLLRQAHDPQNLPGVMCRQLLSVDWQGYVYDCDFNQMLGLSAQWPGRPGRPHLRDLMTETWAGKPIVVAEHCYACTAGQGSSCGGALSQALF